MSSGTLLTPPQPPGEVEDHVLLVGNLRKTYGSGPSQVHALAGVTMAVQRGKLTAIMGPSGSGKSTLLHCLAGLDAPTSGNIFVGETDITGLSEQELTLVRRNNFGFIFQTFNLIPSLTVEENITLPSRIAGRNVPRQKLADVTDSVGVRNLLHRLPSELSGGQQQRVAAARALLSSPRVLFADEPTGSLDTHAGDELLGLLRQAVDRFNHTVLMVTHDPRAAAWADRVVFVLDGTIAGELWNPDTERVLTALGELNGQGPVEEETPGWMPIPTPLLGGISDPMPLPPLESTGVSNISVESTTEPPAESEGPPEEGPSTGELPTDQTLPMKGAPDSEPQIPEPRVAEPPVEAPSPEEEKQVDELPKPTLNDIAPANQLSPHAARVVDQATRILEHLEGSIIDGVDREESNPQSRGEHDRLEP